jgi:hypothetical protein
MARLGYGKATELLVNGRADLDATDDRQRATRDWAESQGYQGVLRALNGEELTDMTLCQWQNNTSKT